MKGKHMKTIWKSVCMAGIFLMTLLCPGEASAQIHSGDARKIGTWWEGNGKSFSSFDDSSAL